MTVAIVLLAVAVAVAVVLVVALLSAIGASMLTRIDGATWPTAFTRAAGAFAAPSPRPCPPSTPDDQPLLSHLARLGLSLAA